MKPVRYSLQFPVGEAAPWAANIRAHYTAVFGADELGCLAAELLVHAKEPTTYRTYSSAYRSFMTYCDEVGLEPEKATWISIVRYLAWLGRRGTVGAGSLQVYLSAIDRVRQDSGFAPVTTHECVSGVMEGLQGAQVDLSPPAVRIPLPASLAMGALRLSVDALRRARRRTLSATLEARAHLSVAFGFALCVRADTLHSLQMADVRIDPPGPGARITVHLRREKGRNKQQRGPQHRVITLPQSDLPQALTASLRVWAGLRQGQAAAATDLWWDVAAQPAGAKWTAATVTEWLRLSLDLQDAAPSADGQYSSHSLRKGAASALNAIGVTLPVIRAHGGWAADSAVVLDYIDPAVRPCAAARAFFGWLAPSAHLFRD